MMNYQIIKDKEAFLKFIDWLPELEANEKFYCCLFARKKYSTNLDLKADKSQLKRFLSDKARLYDKVKQLEIELGGYRIRGVEIPQETLALYINPNPRNLKKATYDSIIELTKLLKKDQGGFNPHQEVMSCIQRSVGRKVYLDFDVDTKEFDFEQLKSIINPSCLEILQTRGGYHILVKLSAIEPQYKKSFYNNIVALGVDQTGDQLLPVQGCTQGGFIPRFIGID
ncbi:MAG: hypothetical protein GY810_06505 [Aureispira sp.]|nr:hypothetical protein [Aureispira sp.]